MIKPSWRYLIDWRIFQQHEPSATLTAAHTEETPVAKGRLAPTTPKPPVGPSATSRKVGTAPVNPGIGTVGTGKRVAVDAVRGDEGRGHTP